MPASAPGALRGAIDDQATTAAGALPAGLGALAPLGMRHRLRLQLSGPRFYGGPSFYFGSPGYPYRYDRRRW